MIKFLTYLRRWLPKNLYRGLRNIFVAILNILPFGLRLRMFSFLARFEIPYRLISVDDCVLQIGMPADLLVQGRSRSLLFWCMRPRSLLVIEPDPGSIDIGRRIFSELNPGKPDVKIELRIGAVSVKSESVFLYVNRFNQATNFIKETNQVHEGFEVVKVEAKPIVEYLPDNLRPSVLSITTNGGEEAVILQYLDRCLKKDYPRIICIAPPQKSIEYSLQSYGYSKVGNDDRGITFMRNP